MGNSNSELSDLQAFLLDNPQLEQLENLLSQFNIFEALRAVHVELRHSEFLAFLMDPQQNHGLGDRFVRLLLQAIMLGVDPANQAVRPIDLEIWDLDDLEVQREWQGIDILLLSPRYHLVVVIENKIHSGESLDQLKRYRQYIEKTYPNWQPVYLFLTPEGISPLEDEHYLPVSYRLVSEVLDRLINALRSSLRQEIVMVVNHYTHMLRRYIVNDDIAQLCRQIYRKHKRAIDLIIENIPSRQAAIKEILDQLIREASDTISPDYSRMSEVAFIPKSWDTSALRQSSEWSIEKRVLLFYFENRPDRVRMMLTIGPGPVEVRQKLLDIAKENRPIFQSAYTKLNQKWNNILVVPILNRKDLEEMEFEELEGKLKAAWQKFLDSDLDKMDAVLRRYDWIWS